MGDKSKIDKLFSDGLNDFEASPTSDSWARIDATIEKQQQKKRALYWRWASIAAAVVLAFYTGYYFNDNDSSFGTYPKTTKSQPTISQPEYISHEQNSDKNEQEETKATTHQSELENSNNTTGTSSSDESNIVDNRSILKRTAVATQDKISVSTNLNAAKGDDEASSVYSKNEDEAVASSYSPHEPVEDSWQEVITIDKSEKNTATETEAKETAEIVTNKNTTANNETVDYAEVSRVENQALSRFSISAMISPTFPFTDVTVNQSDENTQNNLKQEKLKTSYSYGLGFGYRVSKKLELQTGIMINNWHQEASGVRLKVTPSSFTTSTNTSFDINGNTSLGNVNFTSSNDPTNQGKLQTVNVGGQDYSILPGLKESYRFVEVPLTIGYYLVDSKRWYVKVNIGLNSRFITESKVTLKYADGSEVPYENIDLETYSVQLIGGAGAGIKLGKHWEFGLHPTVLYGITQVNTHNEVDTYFHQVLIYSSLSYRF